MLETDAHIPDSNIRRLYKEEIVCDEVTEYLQFRPFLCRYRRLISGSLSPVRSGPYRPTVTHRPRIGIVVGHPIVIAICPPIHRRRRIFEWRHCRSRLDIPPLSPAAACIGRYHGHEAHIVGPCYRIGIQEELAEAPLAKSRGSRVLIGVHQQVHHHVEGEPKIDAGHGGGAHRNLGYMLKTPSRRLVHVGRKPENEVPLRATAPRVTGSRARTHIKRSTPVQTHVIGAKSPLGPVGLLGPHIGERVGAVESRCRRNRAGIHHHPVRGVGSYIEGILPPSRREHMPLVHVTPIGHPISIVLEKEHPHIVHTGVTTHAAIARNVLVNSSPYLQPCGGGSGRHRCRCGGRITGHDDVGAKLGGVAALIDSGSGHVVSNAHNRARAWNTTVEGAGRTYRHGTTPGKRSPLAMRNAQPVTNFCLPILVRRIIVRLEHLYLHRRAHRQPTPGKVAPHIPTNV